MRLKVSNVCQLLDKSKYPETQTIDGVTFTNNGDGTITANGTSTKNYASYNIIKTPRPPIGHKILVLPENNYNTQNHIFIWGGTDDGIYRDDLGYGGSILTITEIGLTLKRSYTTISISLNVNEGWVMNNHIYKPQLFDLTEMYGIGNEPTTVEQFRQDFPNEMYDYSPECWKKFRRLKYITETKNLFDIHTEWEYPLSGASDVNLRITNNTVTGTILPDGQSAVCSTEKLLIQTTSTGEKVYYISGETTGANIVLIRLTDAEGNLITSNGEWSYNQYYKAFLVAMNNTFYVINDSAVYLQFGLRFAGTQSPVTFTNLQLELGSTATPYQPYGYLPLRRGKYIANKEPVQLLDKSKYPATKTENGITWTNNGDGTITTTGTASNLGAWLNIDNSTVVLISNHNYLLCGCPSGGTTDTYWLRLSPSSTGDPKDLGSGIIFTAQETATYHPLLQINPGQGDNLVWKPQLFDLTEMYGAGNEPTTIAQFKADFPNELYDYNPYNAITFR